MGPESERIASLGAGHRLLVFSFWTGELPEITRLHFLTVARSLPRGSRYVLFIDKAVISPPLLALLSKCGVDVVAFDLAQLMQEAGLSKLLQARLPAEYWLLLKNYPRLARFARLAHFDRKIGFDPRYNILFGGPPALGVMKSNYVRALVGTRVKADTLYMDIDFAFTRPLDWIFEHGSFVYRWERRSYANSALMFVRKESPIKDGVLLKMLSRAGTGKCRVLFSEKNCRACGLEILSCDRLDPLWSSTNPSRPAFSEFFRGAGDSEERLRFLRKEFDAIHWHNQWNEIPESGSPYELWMREFAPTLLDAADALRKPVDHVSAD